MSYTQSGFHSWKNIDNRIEIHFDWFESEKLAKDFCDGKITYIHHYEAYYKKSINDMLENDIFSNYEIYQLLLLLGNKKNSFNKIDVNDRLKIYVDKISGKKYTKKSSI